MLRPITGRWQRDAKGGVGFQRLPHPLTGSRQAFLTEFRAHVHALRVDEGDVVDADEAQHLAQIGFLVIETTAGVDPAAGGENEGALAL